MKPDRRALVFLLALSLAAPLLAEPPRAEEDIALEQTETNVLQIRRDLFRARQRNDRDAVKKLEKQFDKVQKERVRLLRETQRM